MPRWSAPSASPSASRSVTSHFADVSGRYPSVDSSPATDGMSPCSKPSDDSQGGRVSSMGDVILDRGTDHPPQKNQKTRRCPLAGGIVGRMSSSARTVLPLAFVVLLTAAPSWCSAREAPHYFEIVRSVDPAEAHGFFSPGDTQLQTQALPQEKIFSLVPSNDGSTWGDPRERFLDKSVLNGGVSIEEEEIQPNPYTAPRKRGAIVLDKLMFALQKAIDEPGTASSSGAASQGLGKPRVLPSGPMDLQRRGNSDGRLYWRCYFNAVSCFRRK